MLQTDWLFGNFMAVNNSSSIYNARMWVGLRTKWRLSHKVELAICKSALNPPVICSTDRSKAVVPVLVLLFVALWFILRGGLLCVFPCVILFLCFQSF